MNKILVLPLAIVALLSGCVAYERPYHDSRDERYYSRDRDRDGVSNRYDRDRDGDGVPNRRDTRPDDRRRY